jgi:peptidoglycan lytic transglycosylase G
MIEREVVVPRERRLVAAVVYNRLRAGMPLGIDATLRYGLQIPPTEPITLAQLDSPSAYNTRKLAGLPPTPIANPGLAAMQAAAHPATVDYLYFVRKPDCRSHFFTANGAAFDAYTREGLQC